MPDTHTLHTHTPLDWPLTVNRASKLVAKDPNGKSDPFCVIHLGSPGEHNFKTEVKNGTLEPVWDEGFTIQSKQLSPYVFTAGNWQVLCRILSLKFSKGALRPFFPLPLNNG